MKFVIKIDDYVYGEKETIWCELFSMLEDKDIYASIGVIGHLSLVNFKVNQDLKMKSLPRKVEIWNHGYEHERGEFLGQDLSRQLTQIAKCHNAIKEIFGYEPLAFGAPFNDYDENTVNACCELGYKYFFGAEYTKSVNAIKLDNLLTFETSKFYEEDEFYVNPVMSRFKKRYATAVQNGNPCVIQIHPRRWNLSGIKTFSMILDYIINDGGDFVSLSKAQSNK
ncbi:polysaccharide deacetylase family protein [Halomonas sp. LR3S48]|uniref:polysaccharide deacetylase family protein n=1 Tax=Halomonas sp. LR3S48 TaxID=2982694 RepID=UPI0021E3A135|nr:polysaccharide deacetylase family protein [Halomonas sp. LR3S48]UYG01953.1 polysaccharide deacetylase family protein [Halomonas sp. LR3S48]